MTITNLQYCCSCHVCRMEPVDSELSVTKSQALHSSSLNGPDPLVYSSLCSSSSSSFSSSSPSSHPLATSSSTTTTYAEVDSGNKPHSHPSKDCHSPLSGVKKDSSHYQLVFGLDDTNSEISLTDNSSSKLRPHSSPENSRADAVEKVHLTHTDLAPSSHEFSESHKSLPSIVSSLSSSPSPQLTGNAELPPHGDKLVHEILVSENSALVPSPVRGDEEGTDGTLKDHKPNICVAEKSENSQTNVGDRSSCKPHSLEHPGSSDSLPTSDSGHEMMSSSLQRSSDSHNVDPGIKLDDASLHSDSISPSAVTMKAHPLSVLTSDSDADEDASSHAHPARPHSLYSPILNTSGGCVPNACMWQGGNVINYRSD